MPVLNSANQIAESALANISKSFEPRLDLAMAVQKQLTIDLTPIFEVRYNLGELLASAFVFSVAEIFRGFAEEQTKMFEMLRESLVRAIPTNLFENLFPFVPLAQPQTNLIPVYEEGIVQTKQEETIGLEMTTEGRFFYNGHLLRTISTNSKHGKLLKLLLTKESNYITDDEISKTLDVIDYRGIGYLRRDLKKKLREAIFLQQDINPNSKVWDIRDYARYVLTNKNIEEKRELFNLFNFPLFVQNGNITSLRAH